MDKIGVLDVAFGGGEPTLYPYLVDLCKNIWNSTNLGISITTNGNHLTEKLINSLESNISILRFSIDAMEPLYSQIRGHPISSVVNRISYLRNKIPFGINSVINNDTINHLDDILEFAIEYGAENLLLLPQIENERFILDGSCWLKLENWINGNWREIPLEISSLARSFLNCPFLFNSEYEPRLGYWHIGADGKIRETSYCANGTVIRDGSQLIEFFEKQATISK
jgi:MoaA/NifB/PqqE/SkfB family radical SAM enzyme